MTTVPELLAQGKHAEALNAFGFNLNQQKLIVERIQAHAERYGPIELFSGVESHHYNQLDSTWGGTNLMILACTPEYTMRIIGYRGTSLGHISSEVDFDVQRGDFRNCDYPVECTCYDDDDDSCVYCDYGRSYCTHHDNYH